MKEILLDFISVYHRGKYYGDVDKNTRELRVLVFSIGRI